MGKPVVKEINVKLLVGLVAAVLAAPGAAPPARADQGVGTVFIAAATAGVTAAATYFVKDYFDGRKETKQLERDMDDLRRETERVVRAAAELERENEELKSKIKRANDAAAFWQELIFEDQDFFKPPRPTAKELSFERGLELLYIKDPALVEKISKSIANPAGEYERYIVTRAYGGGTAVANFGEIKKRMEQGLVGGIVTVAGEEEPRCVSGAENLMALVDYVKGAAGDEYPQVLRRVWGLSDEEMDVYFRVFPQ